MLKFLLFLNNIMNVLLGIMEKTQQLGLRNIVTIQFYNRYFYSRTKIERFILRLRQRVLSMSYVCKTETRRQHLRVCRHFNLISTGLWKVNLQRVFCVRSILYNFAYTKIDKTRVSTINYYYFYIPVHNNNTTDTKIE